MYNTNKKGKYKIFAILYSLVVMLAVYQAGSLVFGGSIVAVDEWNTTTKPLTGISIVENSSSKTTMLVSTPSALDYALNYASSPISNVDLTIELVNSIDMSAKYIKPKNITSSKLTKLTIIGHGNTISGLKYSTAVGSRIGLISYITKPLLVEGLNLRVNSPKIETSTNAFGALVGVTECNDITITKCAVYGTITVTNCADGVGGLIGYTNSAISSINNCWSYCTITSGKQDCYVGGLAGYLACGSVYNCANFEGTIKSTAKAGVGGLFGYASGASTYSKCFNQAKVESNGGSVGGLIGILITANVQVNDCYNNADLSCNNGSSIGGLIGSSASALSSGLTFNRCYSNGELKRADYSSSMVEDSNYKDTLIAEYYSDHNGYYYDYDSTWQTKFNTSFNIQNSAKEPVVVYAPGTPDLEFRISKLVKTSVTSVSIVSLCGDNATYNNSFCYNSYKNEVALIKFDLKFLSHEICTITIYSGGKYSCNKDDTDFAFVSVYDPECYIPIIEDHYFLCPDLSNGLGDNHGLISQISDSGVTSVTPESIIFPFNSDKTQITIKPKFKYTYDKNNSGINMYGNVTDEKQTLTIDLPTVTTSNTSALVNSASDINLSTLGSAFAISSDKNGGLPILKDFYWEYNS